MNQPEAKPYVCPRRSENPGPFKLPEHDTIREDGTCSYCGSLSADLFMQRLEAGDVMLGPTDKSYKVYVTNHGGEAFKQTYRDCPRDERHKITSGCTGPDDCTHWVTRDVSQAKFYFQHLSRPQMIRFVELHNSKHLKLDYPGHFYRFPFFMVPVGDV